VKIGFLEKISWRRNGCLRELLVVKTQSRDVFGLVGKNLIEPPARGPSALVKKTKAYIKDFFIFHHLGPVGKDIGG